MTRNILLGAILALAFIVRIFRIDTVPGSLYWDEVAIGYNSWSILKTGMDEYGHRLPLFFESFQDFKLPGYVYSAVGSMFIFGLNAWGVRIPSAMFGVISVWCVYGLVSEWVNRRDGLIASLLFAITPWHIHFSRAGFEAMGGMAVYLTGLWICVQSIRRKKLNLFGVALVLASMYFYNSYRVIALLTFASGVGLWVLRRIRVTPMQAAGASILIFLCMGGILLTQSGRNSLIRYNQVGIIGNREFLNRAAESSGSSDGIASHRYVIYLRQIGMNLLAYGDPRFLIQGDGNTRHSPRYPLIYPVLLLMIPLGAGYLVVRHRKAFVFVVWLTIISIVPAALSIPSPHTLRASLMAVGLIMTAAFGIKSILGLSKSFRIFFLAGVIGVIAYSQYQYHREYFIRYPVYSYREWAGPYRDIISHLIHAYPDKPAFITGAYWRPYIFVLFYSGVDPRWYQSHIAHDQVGRIRLGYASYDISDRYYSYDRNRMLSDDPDFQARAVQYLSETEAGPTGRAGEDLIDPEGGVTARIVHPL